MKLLIAVLFVSVVAGKGGLDWNGYSNECTAGVLKWKSCLAGAVEAQIHQYAEECIAENSELKQCSLTASSGGSGGGHSGSGGSGGGRSGSGGSGGGHSRGDSHDDGWGSGSGSEHESGFGFGNGIKVNGYSRGRRSASSGESSGEGLYNNPNYNPSTAYRGFPHTFHGNEHQYNDYLKCSQNCGNQFTECFNKATGGNLACTSTATSAFGRTKRDSSSINNVNPASHCHRRSLGGHRGYDIDCGRNKTAQKVLLKCIASKEYRNSSLNPLIGICRALSNTTCMSEYKEIPSQCLNQSNLYRQAYCKCKPAVKSYFSTNSECSVARGSYGENYAFDFRAEPFFEAVESVIPAYIDLPFHPFDGFCNESLEQICQQLLNPQPNCSTVQSNTNGFSNVGRNFVTTFHPQPPTETNVSHIFILSTSAAQCNVLITVYSSSGPTSTNVALTNVSSVVQPVNAPDTDGVQLNSTECDFAVYGLNYAVDSADGWVALPVESLGKEYVVLGVEQASGWPIQLSVVAAVDNTVCTFTFPDGSTSSATLNAVGVAFMTSNSSFTGTVITCNNNVTVLTGQAAAVVPLSTCGAADHAVEQLPPVSTLGQNFTLVPLNHTCFRIIGPACAHNTTFAVGCLEFYRVLAAENNTVITVNGTATQSTFTLQAGEASYVVINQSEVASLVSSSPVLVGHYFQGQAYEGSIQDPSFALVPQIESFASQYRGATCIPGFRDQYINVVIPAGTSSDLLLNGNTFLNASLALPIPGTSYEGYKYVFNCTGVTGSLSYTIQHQANLGFGLLAYGFDSVVSYGWPGGFNLKPTVSGCN